MMELSKVDCSWGDCIQSNKHKYFSISLLQRKQKDVQKENEFYIQLLQQALPPEQQHAEKQKGMVFGILIQYQHFSTIHTEIYALINFKKVLIV